MPDYIICYRNLYSTSFHIISIIAIFTAAIIPIYISIRITDRNKSGVRTLTIILAAFVLIHGFYHLAELLGYHMLGDAVLEPLSVLVLIIFGVIMIRILYPNSILSKRLKGG